MQEAPNLPSPRKHKLLRYSQVIFQDCVLIQRRSSPFSPYLREHLGSRKMRIASVQDELHKIGRSAEVTQAARAFANLQTNAGLPVT